MHKNSLTKGRKLGYCAGIATESILYNMYYTYYLFFLTDVAHMGAGLAGTVSLISVIWDAVTDPIIGHFADKPGADKRKFMLRAAFPVGITFIGAFLPLGEQSDIVKFIFYTAMTMLFWLAYTVYTIPYYAVVAEITEDYDERTAIRGTSSMFNTVCIFIGNAVPSVLPGLFVGMGVTLALGWILTAVILSVIAVAVAVVASLSLKGVHLKKASETTEKKEKFSVKEYVQILKIKPFRWFVMFVFFFLIASSMIQTNFAYLVQGRLGMSSDDMVIVIVTLVAAMAVFIPIITKVAEKTDRRKTSIIFISIMFAALVVIRLIGIDNTAMLIASVIACAIGLACFWTVFYSMAYDLVEVDEFVNGKRRESMITAFPQFFQKFGAAIGMWITGQVLDHSGYDGTALVQSESARDAIENIATVIPAVFLVLSIVGLVLYPVTKSRFALLSNQLELKRQGKQTSCEGLEKLI
ncbi:MAG: MFS transporter [Faecalibacterium sp.]|nr:MFS transporter [Ruminococcus sp.]MCM1392361.1 MFS transporter [Ruminococcus sp.]MCM1485150.1 MFS transporter [Faecalibacterium sp.]